MNAKPPRAGRARLVMTLSLLALVVLGPLVAATGGADAAPPPTPAQAHVLRIGRVGFPDTFDPQTNDASFAVPSLAYEGLAKLDERMNPAPAAAESWEFSGDGLTLTFRLQAGLTYNDGSPLTAERFRYAVERDCDPHTAAPYVQFIFVIAGCEAFARSLDAPATEESTPAATPGPAALAAYQAARAQLGVRALDARTLQIRLLHPAAYLPVLATTWLFYPVPREVVAADPDGWWRDPAHWIGNGPFAVSAIDIAGELADREVRFVPNPHYWDGQPRLHEIVYRYFDSDDASLAAYRNGELEVSRVPYPYGGQPEIADDPQLRQELQQNVAAATIGFGINLQAEPFQDRHVREAFAYGLDRESFCREVWSGACRPTESWIPPGVPGHLESAPFAYDPAAARKALAASSYGGPDRLPAVTYRYAVGDAEGQAIAEWLAANYRKSLGIELTLLPTTDDEYEALDEAGAVAQFDWWSWHQDYPDPKNWLSEVWTCDSGAFAGPLGYCNPKFDDLVARADREMNQTTRLALYDEAQRLLIADAPIAIAFNDTDAIVVKPSVVGYTTTPRDLWPGWSTPLTVDVLAPGQPPAATPSS